MGAGSGLARIEWGGERPAVSFDAYDPQPVESSGKSKNWWQARLSVEVFAGVISGLLVILIAGLVSDLDLGEVLLYIGLPVLVFATLALCALAIRRGIRTARAWKAEQESVSAATVELRALVRRLYLSEVIHSAQVSGWTVTDRDDSLVFVSPDDDEWPVYEAGPHPEQVAEHLENLAPGHFKATSIPFIARVGSDAAVGRAVAERLEDKTIPELKLWVVQRVARAALADVESEAQANGWEVVWGEDSVYFERRNDRASVAFDNIDITRLRRVLGLKRIKI